MNHTLKRIILFTAGLGLGLTLLTGTASAAPKDEPRSEAKASSSKTTTTPAEERSSKDHDCNGTHHSKTGHGANDDQYPHAYSETCNEADPAPSGNGAPSESDPSGVPCAGCVGNADDKNPPGQAPDAQHDGNNGYECDRKGEEDGGNNGIAFGNPAHTGCAGDEQSIVEENEPPVNITPINPVIIQTTVVTETPVEPSCPAGHMKVDVNNDGVLDASDCVPVCADGPMTVDVNGDGKLNGADCALAGLPVATAVLGVSYERPAEAGRPAEVLGTSFERVNVAPATLARTGSSVELAGLLMSGLALIAFGTMLLASKGRRPGVRATC